MEAGTRTPAIPDGWISLNREQGDLEGQIERQLRDKILHGAIAPGARLPSSRALAEAISVSRSTTVKAYERLKAEGYLEAREGSASRVTSTLPIFEQTSTGAASEPAPREPPSSSNARRLTPGLPDLDAFPHRLWNRALRTNARHSLRHDLGYGDPEGLPALRQAVLDHARQYRGVQAEASQVVILPSTRVATSLLAEILLDRHAVAGERVVWFEEPGYISARDCLRAAGAHMVGVPCDAEGLNFDGAPGRPRLIYVTPSHHYPSGVTLSLPRRLALLEYARDAQSILIEDDYDSEFHYSQRPILSLQGIDRQGVVAYLGTFSKVLAPGLRTSYAILPHALAEKVSALAAARGLCVPIHIQSALAGFIADGHLRSHIRHMREQYRERMGLAKTTLSARLGNMASFSAGEGGLQLLMRFLSPTENDVSMAARLAEAGFGARALSPMYLDPSRAQQGLLIGIARASESDLLRLVSLISLQAQERVVRT